MKPLAAPVISRAVLGPQGPEPPGKRTRSDEAAPARHGRRWSLPARLEALARLVLAGRATLRRSAM